MKDEREKRRDYEVGYRKPPKQFRFQKGQSGNIKGRPKEANGFDAIVRRELDETVDIRQNGRVKKVCKREVIIKQLVNRAAEGNLRALEILMLKMEVLQRDWLAPGRPAGDLDPEALERARVLIRGMLD